MNKQSTFTTRLTAVLCVIGCFLTLSGGLISLADAQPTTENSEAASQTADETSEETTVLEETEDLVTTEDPLVTEPPSITESPEGTDVPAETTTTAPAATTTAPRPSTRPVTKTGAVQSMPNSPLSTDPVHGPGPGQTVPGGTPSDTLKDPVHSQNTPLDDSSDNVGENVENAPVWEENNGFGTVRILVSILFGIAAIVSTVAVILIKFMKRP